MDQKLCIGMPAYNSEEYIGEAIESLLGQTFSDFLLVISDNASTDNTEEICRKYQSHDKRIYYYRNQSNIGSDLNYNKVLTYANTKYFKWSSSNDIHHKDYVKECVDLLEKNVDVVLAFPRTKFFNTNLHQATEHQDNLDLRSENPVERFKTLMKNITYCNIMYGVTRTNIIKKVMPLKNYDFSDYCLLAELALHGKFFEVPEYMFYRRFSKATNSSLMSYEEQRKYYDPTLSQFPLFIKWKLHINYIKAVLRSPISMSSKVALELFISKKIFCEREDFISEITEWLKKNRKT